MNIVITGASKGMGKAMALRFALAKNNIFICARHHGELEQTAREIEEAAPGSTVKFLVADLGRRTDIDRFAAWLPATPDILINNAGQFLPGSIYNEPEGTLESMMEVNVYSAYHLTRALLPAMMERRSGHIFNMCSIASLHAYHNGGSYSISKYALRGFSKNLREEMKPYGIKVTAVYPGAVYTASWEGSGADEQMMMTSEDIAALVFSAASLSPQACVEDIMIRPLPGDLP